MGPVALGDSEIGQEAPALGIFDQMQNARKEVALGLGAADIDDRCVLKFVIKEPQDAITRVVVQRVESFVDHHQTRLVQQDTREDQTLLFLIAEFLIPAGDLVQ